MRAAKSSVTKTRAKAGATLKTPAYKRGETMVRATKRTVVGAANTVSVTVTGAVSTVAEFLRGMKAGL